jgi:long-chain acyl-CoA synthetase
MVTRQEVIAKLISAGRFELAVDEASGYPLRVFKQAPSSLCSILRDSRNHGALPYIVYQDEILTYADHYAQVAALAHHLREAGVAKGDRVALGMRNLPEWPVAFWACQAIGAIVVSLNAWWTGAELQYALADCAPAALIVDGERLERVRPHLPALGLRAVIVARRESAGEGGIDFEAITAAGAGVDLPDVVVGPHDLATILYTSGTTGKPKGATANQRNHITGLMHSLLLGAAGRIVGGLPAEGSALTPETQPGSLQTLPFFHIGGLTGLLSAPATGAKVATLYRWSAREAVELIEKHRLTSVSGVPFVIRQLLEEASSSGRSLSSLAGVGVGGAPVPPDLIEAIGERFRARIMPSNGYGLTETTGAIIFNSSLEYLDHPDSIGRPQPTVDVRIADEAGNEAPTGQVGELWVRGPTIIPGYWRNPASTEASFGGGWFRSGDLGYVDAAGLYYVVDRKKDVIIRGGENVYCAEVEAALVAQPEVIDAAVFGLPHPEYGEEVAAVVQVKSGAAHRDLVDLIRERLAESLARFKTPTALRVTESELPRTATGKVLKRELQIQYFPVPEVKPAPQASDSWA